jgi:hypothetical protein
VLISSFYCWWSPLRSGDYQQKLETSQPPICVAPRKANNADNDPQQQQQQQQPQQQHNKLSALSTMAISGRGSSVFRCFASRSTN